MKIMTAGTKGRKKATKRKAEKKSVSLSDRVKRRKSKPRRVAKKKMA